MCHNRCANTCEGRERIEINEQHIYRFDKIIIQSRQLGVRLTHRSDEQSAVSIIAA